MLAAVPAVVAAFAADGCGRSTEHERGTLKLLAKAAGGSLDPHVNYNLQYWQLYQATYDGLLAFKKAGGNESFEVVPDLASGYKIMNGGKTWLFMLRTGIKFSNGQPVTVKDVVASFRRIFKVKSPTAGGFYGGIVGAQKCLKTPATCTLAGGVVGNAAKNTVALNLTSPDPELKFKLALPHASILPASSQATDAGTKPLPTTGPYYFASYDPNKRLVMKRNPYFKEWSHDAMPAGYPDVITETFGLTVEAQITAIENGQYDWTFEAPPADRLNELGTRYANQTHVNTVAAFWFAAMNVNLAPFNNLKARRAVNYAIDRNALVKIYGGPKLAVPSCQVLPPDFPGYRPYCPYTKNPGTAWSAPDIAKARRLVQQSGQKGASVTVLTSDDEVNKAMGVYLAGVLKQIGFQATARALSANIFITYAQNTKNKVQISVRQWYQDYPAASDFLYILFGCETFHPGSDSSINIPGFCNKPINRRMHAALKLEETSFPAANKLWAKIDREVTDQSPMATLFTPKHIDFVSKRVGNFVFSRVFFWLVHQSWVQ